MLSTIPTAQYTDTPMHRFEAKLMLVSDGPRGIGMAIALTAVVQGANAAIGNVLDQDGNEVAEAVCEPFVTYVVNLAVFLAAEEPSFPIGAEFLVGDALPGTIQRLAAPRTRAIALADGG
jgi:hypothetical protein